MVYLFALSNKDLYNAILWMVNTKYNEHDRRSSGHCTDPVHTLSFLLTIITISCPQAGPRYWKNGWRLSVCKNLFSCNPLLEIVDVLITQFLAIFPSWFDNWKCLSENFWMDNILYLSEMFTHLGPGSGNCFDYMWNSNSLSNNSLFQIYLILEKKTRIYIEHMKK